MPDDSLKLRTFLGILRKYVVLVQHRWRMCFRADSVPQFLVLRATSVRYV